MNRTDAKELAEKVTSQQILDMFNRAKKEITDWTKTSNCNPSFDKGCAWNILTNNFDSGKRTRTLARTNMIREFGEYLDKDILDEMRERKAKLKTSRKPSYVTHQQPKFDQLK